MNEEWIVEWRQLEQNATTQRGEALRIYDVVDQNSEIFIFYFVNTICLNEICIPKLRAVLKFAWNYWRQKGGLDSFLVLHVFWQKAWSWRKFSEAVLQLSMDGF